MCHQRFAASIGAPYQDTFQLVGGLGLLLLLAADMVYPGRQITLHHRSQTHHLGQRQLGDRTVGENTHTLEQLLAHIIADDHDATVDDAIRVKTHPQALGGLSK